MLPYSTSFQKSLIYIVNAFLTLRRLTLYHQFNPGMFVQVGTARYPTALPLYTTPPGDGSSGDTLPTCKCSIPYIPYYSLLKGSSLLSFNDFHGGHLSLDAGRNLSGTCITQDSVGAFMLNLPLIGFLKRFSERIRGLPKEFVESVRR